MPVNFETLHATYVMCVAYRMVKYMYVGKLSLENFQAAAEKTVNEQTEKETRSFVSLSVVSVRASSLWENEARCFIANQEER